MRTILALLTASAALSGQVISVRHKVAAGGSSTAFVNSVCGPASPGSGGGASAPTDMTGANWFALYKMDGTGTSTVSSSPACTWTALTGVTNSNIYYAENCPGTGSMTFSVAGASSFSGYCVVGFSGMPNSSTYESGTWHTDIGNFPAPSTTPTGTGQQVVISGSECDVGATTMNAASPFLPSPALTIPFNSGVNYNANLTYAIQTGNAPITATWSQSPLLCGSAVGVIAVFQGGTGGSSLDLLSLTNGQLATMTNGQLATLTNGTVLLLSTLTNSQLASLTNSQLAVLGN